MKNQRDEVISIEAAAVAAAENRREMGDKEGKKTKSERKRLQSNKNNCCRVLDDCKYDTTTLTSDN